MKKILAIVLALALVLSLAACGGSAAPAQTEAPAAADFKVGAIYINSKNDTAGYTFAHHNGITTAMKELGLDPETQLVIVDEVPEDKEQVLAAIDTLVGEGANIIFGISFGYIDAMEEAAAEYTDVIFSHGTGYKSNETNFNNYFGRAYQARYLAGIAAGLKSLEMGNNNVGYVAAYGTEYAETASGINGFALGVLAANPNATIYVKTLGSWADEVNEKAYAEDGVLTDAQGRQVDFKNTVIILTSNLGSNSILEGITPDGEISEQAKNEVKGLLKASFRPEFLNRLDEIIVFNNLTC